VDAVATLRRAVPDDAPSLAVLAERTFRDAFGARNSPENMDLHCARYFAPEFQRREIEDPGLVTTLAAVDGALAGFTQLRLSRTHGSVAARRPSELARIYVEAGWHGRGVARALMQDAIATAAGAGADVLWLGVWEHNPKAMAFYRKFGLEVVGTHPFLLGSERQRDLVMSVGVGRPR
jgi:diamine N-acetyltransferase